MKPFRQITAAVLIALLVLVAGLGGTAHALTHGCLEGPCDAQISAAQGLHDADHAAMQDRSPATGGADHDGCDPFHCNAIALTPQAPMARFIPSETLSAWPAAQLHAPDHARTPDRPPNI